MVNQLVSTKRGQTLLSKQLKAIKKGLISLYFLSEYAVLLYSCMLITYIFFMCFIPINLLLIVSVALFLSFVFI